MLRLIAVIGIGRMGAVHARNLVKKKIKGATLAAVCDTDGDKLDKFSAKYPHIPVFQDRKKMFESVKLDGVIVATPHYSHIEIVKDALKEGINVLSEKPVAVTVSDALGGIRESEKYPDVIYAVMFNQRTNRMYKKAKEIISDGRLGSLRRANLIVTNWYRSQHYYDLGDWRASYTGEGGGLLINQCVHQLDILQWLIGMPEKITAECKTVNRNISVENDVTAVMNYSAGYNCVFTASGHELSGTNRLEISGDNGRIVIGKFFMTYKKFRESEPQVNERTKYGYGNTGVKTRIYSYGLINLVRESLRFGQQANVLDRFVAAINKKAEPVAYGREGINALSIINAIYLSAYNKGSVLLPLNPEEYDKCLASLIESEKNNDVKKTTE